MNDNEIGAKSRLFSIFSSKKTMIFLAALFALGVFLVLFSGSGARENSSQQEDTSSYYAAQIEEKLTNMISGLEGVGKVRVMITLEGSSKNIYAKDSSSGFNTNGDTESYSMSSSVVFGSGSVSSREPVPIGEEYPRVRGVAVVCDGAGNDALCARITELITCSLNITSNRVCVTR